MDKTNFDLKPLWQWLARKGLGFWEPVSDTWRFTAIKRWLYSSFYEADVISLMQSKNETRNKKFNSDIMTISLLMG